MNSNPNAGKSGVKPGAILRAMGAANAAITPHSFDPPHLRGVVHHAGAEPRIELVRDGDRVMRILAHCACGETITIDCDYAANEARASSTT